MAAVLLVHYLLIISARNLLNKEAYKPYLWVMVKRYLYDYKRVHFPDLQRFVFRTVVWTKPVNSVLRYRSKQFLNDSVLKVDKTKSFNILTVSVG
jgi:hypothetical protein